MQAAFRRQAEGLLSGEPDGFVIETMADVGEALCAVKALRELSRLPIVVSMTYDSGEDGLRTMMGQSPRDAVDKLQDVGVDALGANCGRGPEAYVRLTRELRKATDLPLWIKANAGVPELDSEGQRRFPMGPEAYAAFVPELLEAGAAVLGGCCGTTPAHIRAMRLALDQASSPG
jgi:5-methyltetrahydrofolate--homocysteine methyltransferase